MIDKCKNVIQSYKSYFVLITKMDLLPEDVILYKKIDDMPQLAISSINGKNIKKSIQIISEIIQSISDIS